MKKSHNALLCISVSGKNRYVNPLAKPDFPCLTGLSALALGAYAPVFPEKLQPLRLLIKNTKKLCNIYFIYHHKRFIVVKNFYFHTFKTINHYSTFARQGHPQHNIPRFFGRAGRKGALLPKMFSETSADCVKAGKAVQSEGMGTVEDAGAGSEDGSVTGARFQPCFRPE